MHMYVKGKCGEKKMTMKKWFIVCVLDITEGNYYMILVDNSEEDYKGRRTLTMHGTASTFSENYLRSAVFCLKRGYG